VAAGVCDWLLAEKRTGVVAAGVCDWLLAEKRTGVGRRCV
jgi:hypothetical protein